MKVKVIFLKLIIIHSLHIKIRRDTHTEIFFFLTKYNISDKLVKKTRTLQLISIWLAPFVRYFVNKKKNHLLEKCWDKNCMMKQKKKKSTHTISWHCVVRKNSKMNIMNIKYIIDEAIEKTTNHYFKHSSCM